MTGFAAVLTPTAAFADCLINATNDTVTCATADSNGFQSSINQLTINNLPGVVVSGTTLPSSAPILSTGTASVINNEGTITITGAPAGSVAASVGGGSRITEASTATGTIVGDINFGAAGTGQTNTLENFRLTTLGNPTITGNVTSAGGTFVITNNGGIQGNINSTGATTINNTPLAAANPAFITGNITLGTGNDVVNNNGSGGTTFSRIVGAINLGAGDNTLTNTGILSQISGSITALGGNDTVTNTDGVISGAINLGDGNNSVNNATGASLISGNVTLGTGNDTVINNGLSGSGGGITGNIALGDGTNTLTNAGTITGNITGGAGNDTLANALATGVVNGNIDLGAGSDTISNLVGTGTVTKGAAGTLTLSGNNTGYTGANTLQINGGTVAIGAANNMFGGGITLNGGTLQTTGALTLANPMALAAGGGTVQADAATTLSGVISGAGTFTKTGTADLTLSGANTFTGTATVNNGKLILSGGAAIADTTAVVVNSTATTAGTLQVNTAETIGSLAGNGSAILNAGLTTGNDNTSTAFSGVISGTGSLTKIGTGTFTLSGANTYSGGTTVSNGTLAGNATSLQGNILVNVPGILLFNQTANGTYAGALTGNGTFTDTGAGVLTLTGNNSGFTGTTNINGTISIGASNNIGTGPLVFGGGTLQTTGAATLGNAITLGAGGGTFNTGATTTLNGVISGAGGLTKTGASTLILGGANTYTGGTTISAGTLQGTTATLTGNIVDNAALVIDNTAGGTYAGNISGTGSVSTINAGTTTLTGNNTYSGATNLGAGTLIVGPTGIGDSSAVTIASGATLQLAANETIGSLAGAGGLTLSGFNLTTGGNNGSTTYSGVIGGATAGSKFTKAGTGTQTLSGSGTVNAGFAVNGGTLAIGGAYTTTSASTVASGGTLNVATGGALTGPITSSAGSTTIVNGSVTGAVTNAGTLMGTGTVTGAVTNSGIFAPGNGIGVFRIANGPFTQTAAGTLQIELNAAATPVAGTNYDQVLITGVPGTAVLAGTLQLQPAAGLYVNGANYDVIDAAGGITGTLSLTGVPTTGFITFTNAAASGGGIVTIAGTRQVYRVRVARALYNTAASNPNQVAVANGFQSLLTGATGDAATVLQALDAMSSSQAQALFDQASPEPYGAYANALINQGELFTRQIALQMHGTPNSGDGPSIWGRGYGAWGNGKNRNFRFGSDQDIYGGAIGVDFTKNGMTFGGAVGWSHDKIDYNLGNSDGHDNSWQAGIYGSYTSGHISFDLQAAYLHGSFSADRSVNVTTLTRTTSADGSGNLWKAVATLGYNADLSGMVLRPFLGFDYADGKLKSFTESGAGALDLTVGRIKVRRSDVLVGVDLGSYKAGFQPYGRLVYRYDVGGHDRDITAFFNGNSATAFTVSAEPTGRSEVDADVGFSYAATPALSLFAGYEGTFRKDLTSHGVSAGLRYNFGGHAPPPPAPPPPPPPPPPPATQTCPDGSVIEAAATCPVPPPPPPPPPPAPERGG